MEALLQQAEEATTSDQFKIAKEKMNLIIDRAGSPKFASITKLQEIIPGMIKRLEKCESKFA